MCLSNKSKWSRLLITTMKCRFTFTITPFPLNIDNIIVLHKINAQKKTQFENKSKLPAPSMFKGKPLIITTVTQHPSKHPRALFHFISHITKKGYINLTNQSSYHRGGKSFQQIATINNKTTLFQDKKSNKSPKKRSNLWRWTKGLPIDWHPFLSIDGFIMRK